MFDLNQPTVVFHSRGNIELLSQNKVAVFASRNTPDSLTPALKDLFARLLNLPLSLAGGWQSPVEKQLLKLFNPNVKANLIQYFAREINDLKLAPWQTALLQEQKLLIISPETNSKRPTRGLVSKRDTLIFSHCKKVIFLYIEPGGRLQAYFDQLLQGGHAIFLFEHPLNERFISSDVVFLNEDNSETLLLNS